MTGYLRGQPVTQITEILRDQRLYTEEEIKEALKEYNEKNPIKKKKRGPKR